MEKKDLVGQSPVRYFESGTNASLKAGTMGLITAKKGLGKTSVLVQFGIDELLKDNALVHVSFDQQSSNVISWYSSVLAEIAKKKSISNMAELTESIVKNRTILNFNQETFTLPKVVTTLDSLKAGGINIKTIVVDGLNLDKTAKADLDVFTDFVKKNGMTAWFSYTSEAADLKGILSADKLEDFAVAARIESEGKDLKLSVLKGGEGKVNLDSKTLLMCK